MRFIDFFIGIIIGVGLCYAVFTGVIDIQSIRNTVVEKVCK